MTSYQLAPMSNQQKDIINSVMNNNNVIVDSIAGSGKTDRKSVV